MIKSTISLVTISAFLVLMSCNSQSKTMASNDNLNSDTKQEQRNNQRGDQPHRGKRPSFAQLLEKMDANGDARLSKNEVKGPLSNNFSEVDTNADGYITALEFKNAPKPEGKQRPQRG